MHDYRKSPMGEVYTLIQTRIKRDGEERQQLINDLAKVAVFHSIKDGQVTPAQKLMGALGRTDAAEQVGKYLQKFGNIGFGKLKDGTGKGFKFVKRQDLSLELANSVYEQLPDIWDVFPNEPKELADYDFHKMIVRVANEMRARREAGKLIKCANDEEAEISKLILQVV